MKTYSIPEILVNGTASLWLELESNCYIKGIYTEGENFSLKLLTKPREDGGQYVYDSGDMIEILWDIMEIPFISEYGENLIRMELKNQGQVPAAFDLIIYVDKIR